MTVQISIIITDPNRFHVAPMPHLPFRIIQDIVKWISYHLQEYWIIVHNFWRYSTDWCTFPSGHLSSSYYMCPDILKYDCPLINCQIN